MAKHETNIATINMYVIVLLRIRENTVDSAFTFNFFSNSVKASQNNERFFQNTTPRLRLAEYRSREQKNTDIFFRKKVLSKKKEKRFIYNKKQKNVLKV